MATSPHLLCYSYLLLCILAVASFPGSAKDATRWYDDVPGIKVLAPGDPNAQATVDAIALQQHPATTAQFNDKRYAILLLPGTHNISVGTGYYTSVIGVGTSAAEVVVGNVESFDVAAGGATQNFWRSAEGLTVRNSSTTWAVSQACPMRRMVFEGDLWLSEQGPGTHWSSGGFMADVEVQGQLHTGTQQQWCFRNVELPRSPDLQYGGWNYVFIGCDGAPEKSTTGKPDEFTNAGPTPRGAEKPFLVNVIGDADKWQVWVPGFDSNPSTGRTTATSPSKSVPTTEFDLEADVYVAKAPRDKGSDMNAALATGRWKGVLLTVSCERRERANF